ncbi:type IV pilus modification protein PilV [Pseudomonas sp. UBA6310]|uniref:type IV pilus modification protein PilV n=1 Tax=Pseudomonas sp. UBA6310 TaxID=1947327 RepID=UPI00257A9D17|nr:type IV pilus modification protein PilV [Pseudomonas sp. UBA6310]
MRTLRLNLGFSMIEVLVTVVLICIGVLGMVAMQGRTIAYTQDSVQRNTAAMLADDLMEMMRADSSMVSTTGLPASSSGYYKAAGSNFPSAATTCAPPPSSASDRLGCWAERAKAALPDATSLLSSDFHVCRSATPGNCTSTGSAVEIQLAWRVKDGECMDANAGTDDDKTICHYRLRAEL